MKRKTPHSLRVTCASSLLNAGVEEKLIRQRTGHRSKALFRYEKPSEDKVSKVSNVLGPEKGTSSCITKGTEGENLKSAEKDVNVSGGVSGIFSACAINIFPEKLTLN